MTKTIISILIASFGFANGAKAGTSLDLNLDCEASQVVQDQPCGGTDSRHLNFSLSTSGKLASSYKEARAYGGCYPMSDEGVGTILDLEVVGQTVTFTLVRTNPQDGTGPVSNPPEQMKASYDPSTKELTLDTSKLLWVYQKAAVLRCH